MTRMKRLSDEQILWHAGDCGIALGCETTDPDRTYTFTKEDIIELVRDVEDRLEKMNYEEASTTRSG